MNDVAGSDHYTDTIPQKFVPTRPWSGCIGNVLLLVRVKTACLTMDEL